MAVSVELIVTTLGRFPHGIVDIVPTQLPANFLARAGVEAGTPREDVFARFVCDSPSRFGFGFAACCGAGVGFSSTMGAGECSAMIKIDDKRMKRHSDLLTAAIAALYNISHQRYICRTRSVHLPRIPT